MLNWGFERQFELLPIYAAILGDTGYQRLAIPVIGKGAKAFHRYNGSFGGIRHNDPRQTLLRQPLSISGYHKLLVGLNDHYLHL